jgi:nondiscriminating aspartyl-tRNA synthetase
MPATFSERTLIHDIERCPDRAVLLRGWIYRLRALASTTFIILRDCSGEVQCVAASSALRDAHLKPEDTVEVCGRVRLDARARSGFEIEISTVRVLNAAGHRLPFVASQSLEEVGIDARIEHRPLAARNDRVGAPFRIQGAILDEFRRFLRAARFTEIITPKILASSSEGGTNLFALDYFGRAAYLAQSPQLYKEHAVAAFERVFETGHVFRAEPHATSRHLTEYYSLDVELGFIDGVDDLIELERTLLTSIFEHLNANYGDVLAQLGAAALPSMSGVPVWEFTECLERLNRAYGTTHLVDDLDPEAERQLCTLAEQATGVPAVFVVGFPLAARPFYTAHRRRRDGEVDANAAESFDLLFRGLEITTGGQRLHTRVALERALHARGIDATAFQHHLHMFELGMPPHGGFAIGLERLTARILGLANVRDAVLYPRDRYRLAP